MSYFQFFNVAAGNRTGNRAGNRAGNDANNMYFLLPLSTIRTYGKDEVFNVHRDPQEW